jgi:hypothetical protein
LATVTALPTAVCSVVNCVVMLDVVPGSDVTEAPLTMSTCPAAVWAPRVTAAPISAARTTVS